MINLKSSAMSSMKSLVRYIASALTLLTCANNLLAQDQPVFNNYLRYQAILNPAYTGYEDRTSFLTVFRSQWTGFEGAPFIAAVNAHGPVQQQKNVGVGATVINNHAGFTNNLEFFGTCAYRLQLDKRNFLRLGLQLGFKNVVYNSNKAVTVDYGDPVFDGRISKFGFNFGFGAFMHGNNDKYIVGLSIPRFFANKYDTDKQEIRNTVSFKDLHSYIYGGYQFELNKDYQLIPTALVRLVPGSPLTVDVTCRLALPSNLVVGFSYRTVTDIVALIEYTHKTRSYSWHVMYSFDFPLNDIKKYTIAGTHEIAFKIDMPGGRRPGMAKGTRTGW